MVGSEPRLAAVDAVDCMAEENDEEVDEGGLIQSMSMRMGDEDRIFGAAAASPESPSTKLTRRAASMLYRLCD